MGAVEAGACLCENIFVTCHGSDVVDYIYGCARVQRLVRPVLTNHSDIRGAAFPCAAAMPLRLLFFSPSETHAATADVCE